MAIRRLITADMPNVWGEVARINTGKITRSSNWARTGTYSLALSGLGTAPGAVMEFTANMSASQIYGRVAIRVLATTNTGAGNVTFNLMEGITPHIGLRMAMNSSAAIQIVRGQAAMGSNLNGIVLATLNKTLGGGQSAVFEFYVKIHSTEGEVIVKVDGVVDTTLSGVNTRNGGSGIVNLVNMSCYGSNLAVNFDDIAIGDDWCGSYGNYVFWPNGAGDNAGWTASSGNPWECVNADTDGLGDFTEYITDNTSSNKHDFAVENIPFTPAALGAVLVVGAGRVPSGAGSARIYAVSGSTVANGDDMALSNDPINMKKLLLVDPDTNEPWTVAGINGLKIGVESRS